MKSFIDLDGPKHASLHSKLIQKLFFARQIESPLMLLLIATNSTENVRSQLIRFTVFLQVLRNYSLFRLNYNDVP